MTFRLVCPECRGKFPWEGRWPRFCPLCSADVALPDNDDVVMPSISECRKAIDGVYRDMEKGSEQRAQLAADMLGVPVDEMAGLKITNLNDRRDAEIAAMPVNTEGARQISEQIAAKPGVFGFQGAQGVNLSPDVQAGMFPNAGARMRTLLQEGHADTVRKMGAHLPGYSGADGGVSDRPGLETQQPGYRRRG